MTQPALAGQWQPADPTNYAALSFLARYRRDTLRAYSQDLRYLLRWCTERNVEPLEAQRPHLVAVAALEEQRALAPSTIGRRFTTVSAFYRYAERRTVLHPLEYVALLTTARRDGPGSHALVALLGMIGLRVGEAIRLDITDLRTKSGYELLTIMGKGAKPAVIPLPVPVLRAVLGRHRGPDGRAAAAQSARRAPQPPVRRRTGWPGWAGWPG